MHGYTPDGKLAVTKPEPEWDETEQNWMLALAEYRAGLCPVCGGPADECTNPDNERRYEALPAVRCYRTTAIEQYKQDLKDGGKTITHETALMYTARLRDR